ncbi:MAG: FeoB-associated Cys-rich membrane protein [Ruminococcaceae bacterium]|nr:FeoB-associated Cys-rich membrane protein [Oscillospiraceae bacterium]
MTNVIVVLILVAIVGSIVWYLVRAKKRGETCIGCPYAKQCSGKCGEHQKP